jgi:hypothetical protein
VKLGGGVKVGVDVAGRNVGVGNGMGVRAPSLRLVVEADSSLHPPNKKVEPKISKTTRRNKKRLDGIMARA